LVGGDGEIGGWSHEQQIVDKGGLIGGGEDHPRRASLCKHDVDTQRNLVYAALSPEGAAANSQGWSASRNPWLRPPPLFIKP